MSYTQPGPSFGPVLDVRPNRSLICAANPRDLPDDAAPALAIDPVGYTSSYALPAVQYDSGRGWIEYSQGARFRGGDRIKHGDVIYPISAQLLQINDAKAYCMFGLDIDTVQQVTACETVGAGQRDRIRSHGFEPDSGTLVMTSRIVHATSSAVFYEHVVTAQGGSVSGIQFREQFPYYLNNGQTPVFRHSLGLDSEWSCEASEDGYCSGSLNDSTERGYVTLNNGYLDEGACLRLQAIRSRRSDGGSDTVHSGRLHALLLGWRTNANGGNEAVVRQTRLNFRP